MHLAWFISAALLAGCGGADETNAASHKITAISSSAANSCALRAGGGVACWGGSFGTQARDLDGLDDAAEISVGSAQACAVRSGGGIACWTVAETEAAGPVTDVPGLTGGAHVAVGAGHSCVLLGTGEVLCWGSNGFGELGDGTRVSRAAPTPVIDLGPVDEITAGESATCARAGGVVHCWGRAESGALGDGVSHHACGAGDCSPAPVEVKLAGAVEIDGGLNGACARRADGTVAAWGWNENGQLGDGTTIDRAAPAAVLGISDAVAIYSGYLRTCVVRRGGVMTCFGVPPGTNTEGATWSALTSLHGVVAATGGWYHVCALDDEGVVRCLGHNAWHQLGDGTDKSRLEPTMVLGLN